MPRFPMPKKTAKKSAQPAVKKSAAKVTKDADQAMAVVLGATGLSQLKPIRPTKKTALRPKVKRAAR